MRILCVDDSVMFCGLLVRMMTEVFPDAIVDYVLSGDAAMEYLAKYKTDFVLTDVDMPFMDGFALERKVRQQYPDIPVYFETGNTVSYMKSMGIPEGKCVFKPFQVSDLRRLLSDWLIVR